MQASAALASVVDVLDNAAQDPLPAALVAVGGLVVLKFALGVSRETETHSWCRRCLSVSAAAAGLSDLTLAAQLPIIFSSWAPCTSTSSAPPSS